MRSPVGGEVTAQSGSCTIRAVRDPSDCPGGRVPKGDGYEPKTNGCGAQDGFDFVPDHPAGYPFHQACVEHDRCYGTCGSDRAQCDLDFYDRMAAVCNEHWSTLKMPGRIANCHGLALVYYKAVDRFGADPHAQGQVEGCDCCEEREDEPPPPPPPQMCAACSCGGVYADLVDCLDGCTPNLGCFTGICHPVECP